MTGAQRISLADRRAYGRERQGSTSVVKKVDQGPLILLAYLLYVEEELILTGSARTYLRVGAHTDRTIREWRRELEDALRVAGIDRCLSTDGDHVRLDRGAIPPGRCDLADLLRAFDEAPGDGTAALPSFDRDAAGDDLLKLIDPRTRQGRTRDSSLFSKRYAKQSREWRERLYSHLTWHIRPNEADPELARLRGVSRDAIEADLGYGFGALVEIPVALVARTAQVGTAGEIAFADLFNGDERRAMVTAPSGSGKTTGALRAALAQMADDQRALVVLTHADVVDFTRTGDRLADVDGQRLTFVHDRIDNRRSDEQVLELCRFVERFRQARHVVLARDTWGLQQLPMFAEYELRIGTGGDAAIERALNERDLAGLHPDVADLCRTPLYCNMLLSLVEEPEGAGLPRTRYALYERFIDSSLVRHGRARGASRSATASLHPYLALAERLRDRSELPVKEACDVFTEMGIGIADHDVYLTSPILRVGPSRDRGAIDGEFVSWAHASFGSFFLAEDALRRWQSGALTARALHERLGGPENGMEALRFAVERSTAPEVLLDALVTEGELTDVLDIAAGASQRVPEACCDLIVRALDAFKWCEPPCNYPLVRAARDLYRELPPAGRELLPERTAEDLDYLITDEGDAMTFAPRTGDVRPTAELIALAEDSGGPLNARMEAVAALGGRQDADGAATLLHLTDPGCPRDLRIAALLALTKHVASVDLTPIRSYVSDEHEDPTVRSRALDLFGERVDRSIAESLLSLLERFAEEADGTASTRDPGDDLSDSAAWSLCRIGVRDSGVLEEIDGYDRLAALLVSALPHWPLATVVYALATSQEPDAANVIIEHVGDRTEGYLLEDVCHAVGRIGDPSGERYLTQLISRSDDTVVHRHAVLAARAIGRLDAVLPHLAEDRPAWVVRALGEPLSVSGHVSRLDPDRSASAAGSAPRTDDRTAGAGR